MELNMLDSPNSCFYEFYNLKAKNLGDFGMGSGEREIGSKSSSLPQNPGDLAALYIKGD